VQGGAGAKSCRESARASLCWIFRETNGAPGNTPKEMALFCLFAILSSL